MKKVKIILAITYTLIVILFIVQMIINPDQFKVVGG